MVSRSKRPSPLLGAAATLIDDADHAFVAGNSRFKHSFEAPTAAIEPDPRQPRKAFDRGALEALAATLKSDGQLQPVLLRPQPGHRHKWILVAGERRWRAAQTIGWKTILAIEFDGDPEVASLIENLQRVDLTPLEEASALRRLLADKQWTQTQAAEALGKRRSEVSGILNILNLPKDILDVLTSEHPVSRNVLIELARLPDDQVRRQLVDDARHGNLTIRAIRLHRTAADPVTPSRKASTSFNFAVIERVAARLSELRDTTSSVSEIDRARLIRLRGEIDALLDL